MNNKINGDISKNAVVKSFNIDDVNLDKINELTLEPLTKDDIYTFKLIIANNDIDRDFERFTKNALVDMSNLFIGKPLIKDHMTRADNQVGRIFSTEILTDSAVKTELGEDLINLVAYCYVLKNKYNERLIEDIKGGIKKEVSLGISLTQFNCSVCGMNNALEWCDHFPNHEYNGEKCFFELDGVKYANEVSFVVVAAQKGAGVTKSYREKKPCKVEKEKNRNTSDEELKVIIKLQETSIFIEKEKGAKENE